MREITCEDLHKMLKKIRIIDVRTPEEYRGELGHIAGSELVTLGPALETFLKTQRHDQEMVFVCRSGARSGQTTLASEELGYRNTYNLVGGMIRWNELGYEKENQ
ncbi:rhodanese-like domain-containing protein [Bdellovibrio sp. KM01]|uniref:rhodanese-like domain-containing protein n=1 Tax=Bdellovibrio sp. KM01 TaxID=2748865 RepID=UPI0015E900DA|nr:rhodanese-like domain-containing protein [Bdellovibrio sp. KM01]QLY26618.1 rhodanese-like domain-containing protein [Bdellovibrio sp. KM01]